MRALLAVLALSLVCARPVTAQFASGAADARALQLYEQGDAAYAAGRYQEAADAFAQAYRLSPRPLLLYNLANAYERLERYTDAIQMLRSYLDSAPIGEHAELQARIASLEQLAAGGGGGGGGGSGELVLPGVIVAAAGGALLVTGVIFGVLALDAGAGLEGDAGTCQRTADARLLCQGAADGAIADYATFALVADIGLIGGGVAIAAGVTLIVLGLLGGSSSAASAVIPTMRIGPDGAWAGVGGRF